MHIIVPGGGLSADGARWIGFHPGFFLPVKVLSRLFRRLLLEGPAGLHKVGKLRFFGDLAHLSDPEASPLISHRCARPTGSSMPNHPSADPRPCWPI